MFTSIFYINKSLTNSHKIDTSPTKMLLISGLRWTYKLNIYNQVAIIKNMCDLNN